MTGQQLDAIARRIITKVGYGKYFTHGTGHGVGVEIHEGPRITHTVLGKNVLGNGMVFSIEPGIYSLEDLGFGIRIEDTGVLTPDGFKPFNKAPKELIIL